MERSIQQRLMPSRSGQTNKKNRIVFYVEKKSARNFSRKGSIIYHEIESSIYTYVVVRRLYGFTSLQPTLIYRVLLDVP